MSRDGRQPLSKRAPAGEKQSRRVLVVGSTGRLGVAIGQALANRGDEVVLTGRDAAKLDQLAASLDRGRGPAHRVCADLTHRDAVSQIVEGLRAAVPPTADRGSVDDIVLACGPFPRTPFHELRREDLERTMTVHCIAPLLLVHALAGDLAKAQGAVVALSDAGTTRPYEHHVAYLTAKGAVKTGLRALAVELAPDVRVNIAELGIVADPEADSDPLRQHRLATRSQLGRFGTPEEVVHVVLSLLDATWATGEIWGIGR
ncbi:MAG TPA: SDR family oxidoreductase [Labilithrix sp.]|nr:SDR family oxidoreductase [Labilithrix sp.]